VEASNRKDASDQWTVLLNIGAEQTTLTIGTAERPVTVMHLPIGTQRTSREHFRHPAPTPLELENAIQTIEDAIAPARARIHASARLYSADPIAHQLTDEAHSSDTLIPVVSLEQVESAFDQLASDILAGKTTRAAYAAELTILREFMHHMRFSTLTPLTVDASSRATETNPPDQP